MAGPVPDPALWVVRLARPNDNKLGRAGARGTATVVVGAGTVVGVVVGAPLNASIISSTAWH